MEYICVAMAMKQLQDHHKLFNEVQLGGVHCLITATFHSLKGDHARSQFDLLVRQFSSEQLA